jgi:hypothetical protein
MKGEYMKYITKVLTPLMMLFLFTNTFAAEDIVGTWQGNLVSAPGVEMTVQFIISQEADGSYSVTLNSPDEGGIKNVKANLVDYSSGVLKLDVAELSGSYEGVVKEGKIDGSWKQEGTSLPLALSPYVKPVLAKKDMDKLMGSWNGKLTFPGGSLTIVFRFERTEKGEFVGFLDSPDQGGFGIPVTDMEMSEGTLTLKISSIRGEYKGKISDNEIVGEFSQLGNPLPLNLKKGEYVAQVHKLNLPKETMDQLLGEWSGPLTVQTTSLTVVFRFEMTKDGEFVGFHDSPDQGSIGIPITEASLSDGKLTLKIASISGEFKGKISDDKLIGNWSQGIMSSPLTLNKGKYVAPVYKLNLPKDSMDQLSGKWTGKLSLPQVTLSLVFRFEKTGKGELLGFLDSPDQGTTSIAITDASISNGKLTIKVASIGGEFEGQISDDKLEGTWTQGGMSNPLSLEKEKP